jgi:hypothetical protein
MKISFKNMTVGLNIFQIRKRPLDYDQMHQVCLIEDIIDGVIQESSIEDPPPWRHALLSLERI